MKRIDQDCLGRPEADKVRAAVAGQRSPTTLSDVASYLDARGEIRDSDAMIVSEFFEFLAGDSNPDLPLLPAIDPVFQERLRRRLWRLHLLAQPVGPREPH